MKIKDQLFYFNPIISVGDTNIFNSGDLSVLRTVTSYKLSDIEKIQNKIIGIGYKPCTKLVRKHFKYTMVYVRHIPDYQRTTTSVSSKIDGKNRTIMIDDRILYTDEDLLIQKEYRKHEFAYFKEKLYLWNGIGSKKGNDRKVSILDKKQMEEVKKKDLVWWIETENKK